MIIRLLRKNLRREKLRFSVAVLGVAAATGLVVWSLGLTVTAMRQGRERARRMTAPFNCWVTSEGAGLVMGRRPGGMARPGGGAAAGIPAALEASLRSLPAVQSLLACRVLRATLDYRPGGRILQGPPLRAGIVQAEAAGCPYAGVAVTGEWPDPDDPAPVAAVCAAVFTPRRLAPPPIGSQLVLLTESGTLTVRIGAIVDLPEAVPGFPTLFVSAGAMRQLRGEVPADARPNLLLCVLRHENDADLVREQVARFCPPEGIGRPAGASAGQPPRGGGGEGGPALRVVTPGDVAAQLADDKLRNFKRQAPLLLTLAVLTALCMLVNALNVGIELKLRHLALLRTVGMTSRQVARLVAAEGLLIAGCGWAAGLLGGRLVLAAFVRRAAGAFPEGVVTGLVTPAATAAGVALVTAAGLFFPCRRALRIRPLEMLAERCPRERPLNRRRGVAGVLLLFPMLVLALPLRIPPLTRSLLLLLAGLPLHVAGLLLCLPLLVRGVDRLATPAIAAVLRLDQRLLRRRGGGRHHSRVTGMVLTLAVGLGAFVAIHIWGGSMMAPFIPSAEFPDVIVSLLPNGVRGDAARQVAALPGVADGRCLAIEAAQFDLDDATLARLTQAEGRPPPWPNVLLLGVEPAAAFGGARPLAPFRFVAGEREAAVKALAAGGACIITRMFARQSGLGVGDSLALRGRRFREEGGGPPGRRGREEGETQAAGMPSRHVFRIAGVVDLNWHLVTSRAQMRGRDGMPPGTLGPVFVSESDARRLTGNDAVTRFLWLNLSDDYRALGALPAGRRLEADIRATLRIDAANTVRVHHRDEIEDGTVAHGSQLIGDMARVPFWSLIVLCSGIVTLLVASFQSSAREIAVMRAVGMTRGQLARLLLGEAVATACGGIALSLLSGFCIGWTFTGWTRAWMPFGGLPLTLAIPWATILRGIGFALLLCVTMALPPIVWLIRRQEAGGPAALLE